MTHATLNADPLKAGHTHDLIAEEATADGLPVARLWRSRMAAEDGETAAFDVEILTVDHTWRIAARIGQPEGDPFHGDSLRQHFKTAADDLSDPGRLYSDLPIAHRIAAAEMLRGVA